MPYPNKPWFHNQQHEVFPGKLFAYDSDSKVWTRVDNTVSDSELSETVDLITADRDSDLTNISAETINVATEIRVSEESNGFRMTNIGAFDKDDSDNFIVFGVNKLRLGANGDASSAITIHENKNVEFHGDAVGYVKIEDLKTALEDGAGDFNSFKDWILNNL